MKDAADQGTGGDIPEAKLADVSDMSFGAILREDSALGEALRRVTRETHSDEDPYAAFGNFAPDDPLPSVVAA
jgi:FXSXX-COOH protein